MNTTVILKNEIAEIQRLKEVLVEYGKTHHINDQNLHDIKLSVEEAVSNIIFYGYEEMKNPKEHHIEVRFELQNTTFELEIRDDAKPFNPLTVPEFDLDIPIEERETGGMGLHLMRTLMDELHYKRGQDKNVLLMRKHLTDPLS